jgi:hypothetical protein
MSTGKKGFICLVAVCLIVGGLASSASAELLGLWRFEENSGTTAADSSGHGCTGVFVGSALNDSAVRVPNAAYNPTWVAGKYGTALAFSPTFDAVVGGKTPQSVAGLFVETDPGDLAPHDSKLELTKSFTVAMWVWFNDDGTGHINEPNYGTLISKYNSYEFQTPSPGQGDAMFWTWELGGFGGVDQGLPTLAPLPTNTWVHLAICYDYPTTTMKFYLDGVLQYTSDVTTDGNSYGVTSFYPTPWDFIVGYYSWDGDADFYKRAFSGKMDDLAVFNEALTEAQVNTIKGSDFSAWPYTPLPVTPQDKGDLLGLWRFEEGSGLTAADSSAYGNNGILGCTTEYYSSANDTWGHDVPAEGTDAYMTPPWVAGKYGSALHFHPVVWDYPYPRPFVHVPYTTTLDLTNEFTLCAWVYLDAPSADPDWYPHIIAGASSYRLELPDMESADPLSYADPLMWVEASNWAPGHFSEGVRAIDLDDPSKSFVAGQWKHVAVTLSGGTMRSYVDGRLLQEKTSVTGALPPNTERGTFIGFNPTEPWGWYNDVPGALDDVAVFKRALSQSEIQAIMDGNFSGWLPSEPTAQGITANPAGWVEEGTVVTLTGPAGGTDYHWQFEGDPMSDTDTITGTTARVLTFNPVSLDDAGSYTCVYDDGTGKALVETPPYILSVFAAGSLPVAGMIGLGLLAAMTAIGGVVLRRRSR